MLEITSQHLRTKPQDPDLIDFDKVMEDSWPPETIPSSVGLPAIREENDLTATMPGVRIIETIKDLQSQINDIKQQLHLMETR